MVHTVWCSSVPTGMEVCPNVLLVHRLALLAREDQPFLCFHFLNFLSLKSSQTHDPIFHSQSKAQNQTEPSKMPAKKYKLFKAGENDGDPPPCAFFLSPQGCKNGDKCKFSHEVPSSKQRAPAPAPATIYDDSSDVVSSESEGEDQFPQKPVVKNATLHNSAQKKQPDQKSQTPTEPKKKRKRKKGDSDSDLGLFAKPAKRANDKQNEKKKDVELPPPPKTTTPTKPKPSTPKPTTSKKVKIEDAVPSFRSLNLPIASFSTQSNADTAPQPSTSKKETTPEGYPLPQSTPEGQKWQSSVIATRSHPNYNSIFDFDKLKKMDEENGVAKAEDWVKARPFGDWCANNPHAIAIDCEMCETKDPLTGNTDHKALCRLSVVNAVDPDDVLIDTLVKPKWPVVDYRSRINGIKEEDLDNVQFTLSHAQAFMMALCSEETVIIGHAVNNDVAALKMEHHCYVDSALLFTDKDETNNAACSLKDVVKSVTGKEMPKIHCSVNDARSALISIEEGYLKKDGKPDPVERSVKKNRSSRETSISLFVHRIPKGCKPEHLKNMIVSYTSISPTEINDIIFGSDTGKTTVTFKSPEHASLAFKTFENEAKPDKTGRMQKRIFMRNGDYICIRKMTNDKKDSKGGKSEKRHSL